jgi:hypothetical protein
MALALDDATALTLQVRKKEAGLRIAALDQLESSRQHFNVLVPRVIPGTKEGTRATRIRVLEFEESVAAPATVSGEPQVQDGHWETGKAGPKRRRPASQETCQHGHPTGGRGVHTERSFAAVTAMPARRP